MSRFDDLITGSVNLFFSFFFPLFHRRANVVRLSFLFFPFSFRTNVEREEEEEGGR